MLIEIFGVKLLKKTRQKQRKWSSQSTPEKIRNLTKNSTNPLTHAEVLKNLSSEHLTNEELYLLKFGLYHSLPLSRIYKTNVFVIFKMMHRFLLENLKDEIDKPVLVKVRIITSCQFIHS